ncbi:hypothetical protein Taro_037224, partial [Colocasia esculenta]|nr:hypothetical protein [Colocasia esculenta]
GSPISIAGYPCSIPLPRTQSQNPPSRIPFPRSLSLTVAPSLAYSPSKQPRPFAHPRSLALILAPALCIVALQLRHRAFDLASSPLRATSPSRRRRRKLRASPLHKHHRPRAVACSSSLSGHRRRKLCALPLHTALQRFRLPRHLEHIKDVNLVDCVWSTSTIGCTLHTWLWVLDHKLSLSSESRTLTTAGMKGTSPAAGLKGPLTLVVVVLLLAAMCAHLAEASSQAEPSATVRRCHGRLAGSSRCIHLARKLLPAPPRLPSAEEVLPLHGEVKRLVPRRGPNPLHN